jgi:hypothetical protein
MRTLPWCFGGGLSGPKSVFGSAAIHREILENKDLSLAYHFFL